MDIWKCYEKQRWLAYIIIQIYHLLILFFYDRAAFVCRSLGLVQAPRLAFLEKLKQKTTKKTAHEGKDESTDDESSEEGDSDVSSDEQGGDELKFKSANKKQGQATLK